MKTNEEQLLNTRALSLIIIFTALAAALNVYGPKIPFPLAPFLFFSFWEIPIVIAFLFVGPKSGIIVSAINTLILMAVFWGKTGSIGNWVTGCPRNNRDNCPFDCSQDDATIIPEPDAMTLPPRLLQEIELLLFYDLHNPLEGLKIHHDAEPGKIAAAKRLHDLGITTLSDGGYLTARGQEAAELAATLLNFLQVEPQS